MRRIYLAAFVSVACIVVFLPALAQAQSQQVNPETQVAQPNVSVPVRDMSESAPGRNGEPHEKPLRLIHPNEVKPNQQDPALQTSTGPLVGTTNGLNFAGLGVGGGYTPNAAPP